jgi:hypothetical protein
MDRASANRCAFEHEEPKRMKSRRAFQKAPSRWYWASLLSLSAAGGLAAADTNAPPALTPEQMFEGGTNSFNNWVDFSVGHPFVSGDRAQFQQQLQIPAGMFGGISDFHFQTGIATNTTLTLDGRGIIDNHDYKLSLGIQRENTGYLRLSYEQSRTWFDGGGGYFPASGQYYQAPNNPLAVDRGKLSLEGGWTPEKGPKATFKYTHTTRDGEEGSTDWGYTHPTGSVLAKGLSPTLDVIHEHSDSFQLDVSDHIKSTEVGGGLRYETGKLDDALQITQYPGEPIQQRIADSQGTIYDLFGVHSFTETWLKTNILFSSGFSYAREGNNFSASRIYGNDFDVGYAPNAANSFGYYGLGGSSQLNEYVFDFNLLYKPAPHFSIVPSVRVDREDWTASSAGWETLAADAPAPFSSDSREGLTDLRQRLDLNYNGVTNWAFYGRADLTEIDGNLNQDGGLIPVGGIGILPVEELTYDRRFFQKYSAGARWYPSRGVTLDAGGYYKLNQYHYDNSLDGAAINSMELYPGYLAMQDFETYDGNVRLTLRPWRNVTAVSRYEYQLSTIHTEPDPQYGLPNVQSSTMTSHIIAQDVGWTPWSRLSLQSGLNYVLSDTRTPASDVTQGILNAQNNYWTLNFSSLLVLDNKTDLNLSYVYYLSGDYVNDSPLGVPYGAGSEEHAVTATLTRRLSKNIRLAVKYGYFRYSDAAYGGNQNFGANLIYASLRYRF